MYLILPSGLNTLLDFEFYGWSGSDMGARHYVYWQLIRSLRFRVLCICFDVVLHGIWLCCYARTTEIDVFLFKSFQIYFPTLWFWLHFSPNNMHRYVVYLRFCFNIHILDTVLVFQLDIHYKSSIVFSRRDADTIYFLLNFHF